MEQAKSTSIVGGKPETLILTEEQVLRHLQPCHGENLDATHGNQFHDQCEEDQSVERDISGYVDLQSYNQDAHYNEQFSQTSLPGTSLTNEANTVSNNSASRENQTITGLSYHGVSLGENPAAVQIEGTERKTDKVFILHFTDDDDDISKDAILQLASCLRQLHVDVSLDLFEKDNFHGNWNIWYERELKESRIVLCIITKDFHNELTMTDRVKGYSVYNLLSDGTIPFIPVFLESKVNKSYIPLSMRGSNVYPIFLKDIPKVKQQSEHWSKNFENLYSFLTAQSRTQPPELGEVVQIPRHKSVMSEEEKTFSQLKTVTTPVMSLPSHNKMFSQLASNLTAEWEPLGRALDVSEPNMYAIKRDNSYSVTEQAVKMFQQWLRQNGSTATIQVLATAVYESGSKYWDLLKVLCKHAL